MPDRTTLFLSYARNDDESFVRRLYQDLSGKGWKIWWDRESMPNRGLTFTQEIRDAIDSSDRLLLVVGPNAVVSDYVRSEWRHALLFAKGVVPILRLGDYSLIPSELKAIHCPDFREVRNYNDALKELLRILSEPLAELGPLLSDVPALPPHFLARDKDLERLSDLVLADIYRPTVITSARQTTALHGMAGIGKTVQATAFARAAATRRAFLDGVMWLKVGREANLLTNIRIVADAFREDLSNYDELATARARLPRLLEQKVGLIVLDDVWETEQVVAFQAALGARCRLLITTRDSSLASALGALEYSVDLLAENMALALFADWSGQTVSLLPAAARDLVKQCGYLPLAIALSGAVVRDGTSWLDVQDALSASDLEFLDHPHGSIMKSLRVGIEALPPEQACRYGELAVFNHAEPVTESAVNTLWNHTAGMDERHTRRLLVELKNRALLTLDGEVGNQKASLHELQRDYLYVSCNNLKSLNDELLVAYANKCGGDWSKGPNDGYFFQHLGYHLTKSERRLAWLQLLTDLEWLSAECLALEVYRLLDDLAVASAEALTYPPIGHELEAVRHAINASSHLLKHYPFLLVPQLYNSLSATWDETSNLGKNLIRAAGNYNSCWLRVVESASPLPPDYLTLSDHEGLVSGVAFSPDGSVVATTCWDNKIRLWDSHSGRVAGVLDGHMMVNSVAFHPSGTLLATSGWDAQVLLWDLSEQKVECLADLTNSKGFSNPIYEIEFSPDGSVLAGATSDHTAKIWDVKKRKLIRTLSGHTARVCGIKFLNNRNLIATASDDQTIRLWDSSNGKLIVVLAGHSQGVNAIAGSSDGATLASASDDTTVRLWDIDSRRCTAILSGHRTGAKSVAISKDGFIVASGDDDGIVRLWDVTTQTATKTLPMHSRNVTCLRFSPDDQLIASGGGDLVKIWSPILIRGAAAHGHEGRILAGAFSPSGELFATLGVDHKAILWKAGADTPQVLSTTLPGVGRAVAFARNGPLAAVGFEEDQRIEGEDAYYVTGGLLIWDTHSGEQKIRRIDHGSVHAVAFSQVNSYIASGTSDGNIAIWDSSSGELLWNFDCNQPGSRCSVTAIAFSPDGKTLAIGGEIAQTIKRSDGVPLQIRGTGQVLLLDVESQQMHTSLGPHDYEVTAIAFAADGTSIACGCTDRMLRVWGKRLGPIAVWNTTSGDSRQFGEGHDGGVRTLAFSPDGYLLASGGNDHVVKVWSVPTGTMLTWMQCDDEILAVFCDPSLAQLRVADAGGAKHAPNIQVLEIINSHLTRDS